MDYDSIERKVTGVLFHPVAFVIYGIVMFLIPFFIWGWNTDVPFSSNNILYTIGCMGIGGLTILLAVGGEAKDYFSKK